MSMNNRPHNPGDPPTIYTVYQGGGQGNYGFHPSLPQAPPPKYEDVMSGRSGDQQQHLPYPPPPPPPPPPLGAYHQQEVILVAPDYKYSKTHRMIGLLFTIVFLIATTSILVKIMSRH